MKDYTKGRPLELPVPKRTGAVRLPVEHGSPEKSIEFLTQNKEQAKPAKA